MKPATLTIDPYIHGTLLRDLVGHDHRPASFLLYLWISLEQQRRGEAVQISYAELAEETGLSRSASQGAIAWLVKRKLLTVRTASVTATPVYTVLKPWNRIQKIATP